MTLVERIDAQIDIGMELVQKSNLRRQPQGRYPGSATQRYGLVLSVRKQLIGNRIEPIQRPVYAFEVSLPRTGQGQAAMVPDKQGSIQIGFQLAHLLTNCGLRYIEILSGLGKTQTPTGGLEGA
jgi:hypothetical protein